MAKTQITMREVVSELRSQGHSITYYERKDGGILIRSIDGQMFTGATGNLYARAMAGTHLSVKRAAQISQITWTGKRAKNQISDREVKKKLEKVQRKWRKAFPKVDGKVPKQGRKTARKVQWSLQNRGKEETMRLLNEAERYASGKAYSKNIQFLIGYIKDAASKYGSPELDDLANRVEENAFLIMEEMIEPVYQELYKLNAGVPPEEIVRNIERIIHL